MGRDSLEMPLLSFLLDISLQHFKQPYYFDSGTFFWSLSRLFGCYQRVVSTCQTYKGNFDDPFLAQDIEDFIIRHNVLLNDVAFILRKFYTDKELQGLRGLSGAVAPQNREQSFNDFVDFFTIKNTSLHPELSALLLAKTNIFRSVMRRRRLDIIHYKAKAVVFAFESGPEFALIDPGATYPIQKTEGGGERIVTEGVFEFVNETMKSTLSFINEDLVGVYTHYVTARGWEHKPAMGASQVTTPGVGLYKSVNGLS